MYNNIKFDIQYQNIDIGEILNPETGMLYDDKKYDIEIYEDEMTSTIYHSDEGDCENDMNFEELSEFCMKCY